LGSMAHTFCCCRPVGNFLALVFSAGRENLIGRNDRPPCLLRLLVRRLPLDGSANVQTLPAGVSLPPACPAKDTAATVATTTDCKRCPDAASSPASSTIPPIKGPIALQSIDLILLWFWFIYLFIWSDSFLIIFRLICLVGWMIFPPRLVGSHIRLKFDFVSYYSVHTDRQTTR
jgi:hypothetical protein